MATLRSYIIGKKKAIPRGATSRVAEYLGVTHARAFRLIHGHETPDEILAMRIQDFIAAKRPFSARKTGKIKKVSGEFSARFS